MAVIMSEEEFWALPIVELPVSNRYCGLAELKVKGSIFAIRDRDGEWWTTTFDDNGNKVRQKRLASP